MFSHTPENHQQCAVCCQSFFNQQSAIRFTLLPDGGVRGEIVATEKVQGYLGVMQGGTICALHDAAMTHCLFFRDVCAMTAQLDVRFLKPVPLHRLIRVEAHCLESKRGIYVLQSRIDVDGDCCSRAHAKFMQQRGVLGR